MAKSIIVAPPELLYMMNEALAKEIQVSVQYMWQHVQWSGVKGFAVHSEFRSIAIQEMKHAEQIAERLYYLGGIPTTKPSPIFIGKTLAEMIEQDIKDETGTIQLYHKMCFIAREANDETTNRLFRALLADEESHHDIFVTLQEGL